MDEWSFLEWALMDPKSARSSYIDSIASYLQITLLELLFHFESIKLITPWSEMKL